MSDTNMEIVQKSTPIDITYKDAAMDRKEDPHRGGQDANFQWGYVPDEKELRRNPPEFNLTGDALLDACRIRDSDYKMIHDKVSIDPNMKKTHEERPENSDHPKILCVVQTSGHRHFERIPVLRRTWGPKCDGFVAASNITCPSLRHSTKSKRLQTQMQTTKNKIQSSWAVDLLLAASMDDIFNAGGPGYVLNKAALKVFVLESGNHPPQKHTSKEDLMIARAFRQSGVYPYDTQDETGGERFMITTPGHHFDSNFPAWYHKQSIDIQHGKDHCAEKSITFHYVPVELMYRLYGLLYDLCPPTR